MSASRKIRRNRSRFDAGRDKGDSRIGHTRRADTRVVYGARCVWWDTIDRVGILKTTHPLPCCPHCGSVLMEVPDLPTWWSNVDAHEESGHPGYRGLIEWLRGKCFPTMTEAVAAFRASGGEVEL